MRNLGRLLFPLATLLCCVDPCNGQAYEELTSHFSSLHPSIAQTRIELASTCISPVDCVQVRGKDFVLADAANFELAAVGQYYPDANRKSLDFSWRLWASIGDARPEELTRHMSSWPFDEPLVCSALYARSGSRIRLSTGVFALLVRVGCLVSGSGRGFVASDVLIFRENQDTAVIPLVREAQKSIAFGVDSQFNMDTEVSYEHIDGNSEFLYRTTSFSIDGEKFTQFMQPERRLIVSGKLVSESLSQPRRGEAPRKTATVILRRNYQSLGKSATRSLNAVRGGPGAEKTSDATPSK